MRWEGDGRLTTRRISSGVADASFVAEWIEIKKVNRYDAGTEAVDQSGIPILNILGIIGNLKVFFQVAASFLI
jgi:hypothetical protein